MAINIPRIASVKIAVKIYNENLYLGSKEIKELFPGIGSARVSALKKVANAYTRSQNRMPYSARDVLTKDAYVAWQLDIDELNAKYDEILRREKQIEASPLDDEGSPSATTLF